MAESSIKQNSFATKQTSEADGRRKGNYHISSKSPLLTQTLIILLLLEWFTHNTFITVKRKRPRRRLALTLSLFCTSIMRKPVDTWFVWWVKRKICKSEIINSDVSPVDLLPLRPASLTHKIPRRRQIIHENASSRTQRSVDRSEDVFSVVECCSCDFCGSYYGCHLTNNIYFSLCYALK